MAGSSQENTRHANITPWARIVAGIVDRLPMRPSAA